MKNFATGVLIGLLIISLLEIHSLRSRTERLEKKVTLLIENLPMETEIRRTQEQKDAE